MCFFKMPSVPKPTPAPMKTDADIAGAAENERLRMSLSTNGFSGLTEKLGGTEGDTTEPVKRVTLGA